MTEMSPGTTVTCPHCGVVVQLQNLEVGPYRGGGKYSKFDAIYFEGPNPAALFFSRCAACDKAVVQIASGSNRWLVIPRVGIRRPLHPSVPGNLRGDHDEAALVLNDSPKASAALSRRCLQALLVMQGAKKRDLKDQLEEIEPTLPQYVQPYVDHVRELGNLSAHAKQSIATGSIIDVEPGEAEWMLELLEELFDHYYAKPAEAMARQAALKAKIADAGKMTPNVNT
ncbi:MAG: DUF4145 domain-containing protein [Planctomycetes bacterium]|nr:DUF4145 domain-containing protein [Planctomycetota bacterium]